MPDTGGGLADGQVRYAFAPRVLAVLALCALVFGAAFAALTYIVPFLQEVTGISGALISVFLLAYGVATAVGSFGGGRFADRDAGRTLIVAAVGATGSLAALHLFGTSPFLVALLLLALGAFVMGSGPSLQYRVVALAGPGGRLAGPVVVAYEAGPTGFGLARALAAADVRCEVVAPSKMERPPGDKVKTDRRDAERLARLLRIGELPGVRVPSEAEEAARDLVRAREDARGGPSPSVVRAAAMAAVVLLALAMGRGRSAVPALAAAVLVLLLADPALAVDPGFALSVLAIAALVLLAPGWSAALQRRGVPRWVAEALAVPAAAFLATAPLIAGLNGQVSPVAVVANLLAVPAVAPATVLGVLAAVVSPLGAVPAQACAWVAGPAVWWLVLVADRSAAVPGAVLGWRDGLPGAVLLGVLVLGLLWFGRSPRWRALLLAVALGLALVLVPTRVVPPGWPPPRWAVFACDVGQGDAIVLATGRPGWVVLVVLSHLHADHVGGLAGALRDRPVGGVAVGPVREPGWALREVAGTAAGGGVPLVGLAVGRRLEWPALTIDVIGPQHPAAFVDGDDGSAVNDGSLVLRARTPAGTVLLTGDVELAAQADLLASGADLRADVLKMPHHGSRYTSVAFLNAVSPRAVLVSVGAGNGYRHPDPGLVGGLERAGAAVRRTDLAGDVAVVGSSAASRARLPRLTAAGAAMRTAGAGRLGVEEAGLHDHSRCSTIRSWRPLVPPVRN
ncbi:ComEC/Rec2 family competence protein [Pseudonocardia adelaidensis]|uniref:ComEC/Rec2 family competence protein n=1 Tax=Pseudonocardia adelaidensis TaxID=648754 RepID=UPI003CD082AD